MKSAAYKLTEVASNEMLDYAQYTVASRAIPSMVDGLKPVQRFYLYSSIINSPKDFKKVSAVSGVVSDYGYNHGEVSAAAAGQLMAATWSNNICLVEGRGSFGTRQVQSAGAARYVYSRVHANFRKYIKDLDLSPEHNDPEHSPPQYYLPVIPLVLLNGAKGIATGFATNILPRNEKDIIAAINEFLTTGKITHKINVAFPDFTGTTHYDATTDRFVCEGTYRKVGKTTLIIEEIPYGFDREAYVKVLDDLENEGLIVGYDDQCDKQGFRFEVNLKQQISAKWPHKDIMRHFKLSKNHSENLTVIDHNGNLREYTNPINLIKDFVDFRLTILQQRINLEIKNTTELLRWLQVKIDFIEAVLDDKITFKGKGRKDVSEQILKLTSATADDISRLLALNILSLTHEQVEELRKQIKEANKNLRYWNKTTPAIQYNEDLMELNI